MSVLIAKSHREIEAYRPAWDDLAAHAIERNVFYEQWMLIPALEHLAEGLEVHVALVFAESGQPRDGQPPLIGVFPFIHERGYRGLPIRYLTLWRYPQCFLCTPLVREGSEDECFGQFFNWVDSASLVGSMVRITYVRGDGPFYEHLTRFARHHRRVIDETSFYRAMLQSDLDGDAYIRQALSSKGRREFERQGRRLEELGALEVVVLREHDDIDYWIHWLLELEQRGWKGRAGTALALKDNEKEYYQTVARAAYARGQLLMEMLKLDGRPIAIRCTFLTGSCSYGMKIAFDEEYGRYSPGVQLEFHVIRRALSNPNIDWMDSCAEPNHPMFDRLWKERRRICHINISTKRLSSKLLIRSMTAGRAVKASLKAVQRRMRKRGGKDAD